MSVQATAKVCMYRLDELGDCFMLTFSAGDSTSRMLIDCGSFRNGAASIARLTRVTEAIAAELAGAPIDVVVATHQHNDHVSGFVHCEQAFRTMGVGQVWLSWLDNPRDKKAQRIGEDFNNLLGLLHHLAARRPSPSRPQAGPGAGPRRALAVLHDVLGFYGATGETPPELPAKAVGILRTLGATKPEYLKPGRTLDVPGLPPGSVRVHVLGPPRDEDDLYRKEPRKSETYDPSLTSARLRALRLFQATEAGGEGPSADGEGYPFNQRYMRRTPGAQSAALKALVADYHGRGSAWRTIDEDWMQQAEGLALFLDTYTNNSSLVLAIELVASGKVLLFAADAQAGNWSSWAGVKWDDPSISTEDLLARTVLYKVGHHASHNATLVSAFEQIGTPELVALIPVHKKDPNITKRNGWKMPARKLFERLRAKTSGRVLQMDCVNPPECDPERDPAKGEWERIGITPRSGPIAIELEIS